MSGLQEVIVGWVDRRIDEMLATPRMWGSDEAIELQTLLLVELRALALRPAQELENPRRVLETYFAFLRAHFPNTPDAPLATLVEGDGEMLAKTLAEFRALAARSALAENPFEHSTLAIELTFAANTLPQATAVTSYYEGFRRATRAVMRRGRALGRSSKGVEDATSFTLEDVVVTPANGAPAKALLRLGAASGQRDFTADDNLRDALSTLVTLAEWGTTDASLDALSIDNVDARSRAAVQALRLVPPKGVEVASIGGRLVSRAKPVEIRARHNARFVAVIGAGATPEAFDETDEIRAIDLDRASVVLGRKPRMRCYAMPGVLEGVTEVGVNARVVGALYRTIGVKPFVIADRIDVDQASEE